MYVDAAVNMWECTELKWNVCVCVCRGVGANPVRMCNSDCECQGKRPRWRPGLIAMDEW